MHSFRKRSINLNLLDNIHINRKEIILKWFRGLSIAILIISVSIYFLKLIFINITNDTFSIKNDTFDFPSSDNEIKNYSFDSSFINNNKQKEANDSMFILNMEYFGRYINSFNLTEIRNKKRRNKEEEYLYNLYKFNKSGVESHILIDYSSSLPHYPLFADELQKCFLRGEIISLLNNIDNLSCIDISGINFTNYDFILRLSLLDKNSSDIKLYKIKEMNVKNEMTKKEGKRNIIFYENNNMKMNLRFCSNEFTSLSYLYKDIPKNYIRVLEINWENKTQYFCLKNISLIYNE